MQNIKVLISLCFIITLCSNLYAQTPKGRLEALNKTLPKENIYIHYDKQTYVAGETVWFKVYVFSGGLPSTVSTVLTVELLNDSGRVLAKKILPLIQSSAAGNFELPLHLPQAHYTVRAFTLHLVNLGSDFFYEKQIKVFNPSLPVKPLIAKTADKIFLFPQGGQVVAGIPNSIAFKCTDHYGYPIKCSGDLIDSKGEPILNFSDEHDGMGVFNFLPQPGEAYHVSCSTSNGSLKTNLTAVVETGLTFQMQFSGKDAFFIVNTEKSVGNNKPAYLLGTMDNQVVFEKQFDPASKIVRGLLPQNQLPSGILALTLFNKDDQAIAERMVFVNNAEYLLKGNFMVDTFSTRPRNKNHYRFLLTDAQAGNFSVAVTDADKEIPSDSRESIISSIFLTNEIKGYVHNPIYYFENDEPKRRAHLDLVMMTSGWRRFTWEQVLTNRLPSVSYKDPNYISFSGKAYKGGTDVLLTNTELVAFIATRDSATQFFTAPVDTEGRFSLNGLIFQDTAIVTFQNNKEKDKAVRLNVGSVSLSRYFHYSPKALQNAVSPLFTANLGSFVKAVYDVLYHESQKSLLLEDIRLSSVKVRSKTSIIQERYLSGPFGVNAAKVLDLVSNPETQHYQNIFEYLKRKEGNLNISGTGGSYTINYRNTRTLSGGPINMAIFLDGALVNSEFVATIPLREIALVQVYGTGFVGSEGGGAGGAVAIFTRKGEDRLAATISSLSSTRLEGFSPVKEFFSPDYTVNPAAVSTDYRSTLYWNPYIETDARQKTIDIPFFNSDSAKRFKVVIVGIDSDGKMLHLEKLLE